ncbi:Pericentriolar material 1 protein [Eufriesea mexicana]|uniref:Pericentriolar material 1 protein n=1 Tax=Eufriesea mexicana TaxID=516756 RepID=A0A310SE81_9HYME|nr:Pericentriolar material 1 protein [Eufriesea mexicana]
MGATVFFESEIKTYKPREQRNEKERLFLSCDQWVRTGRDIDGSPIYEAGFRYQLDWRPVGEQEHLRTTKNSNTRSVSSVPSTSYQDIPEFVSFGGRRPYNYSAEEYSNWQKMVPPTDSQTQSPPRVQGTKPSNVDKMPDRSQVESRLNQIRDYIRVTSTMMDSLNQSSDPRAQAQNEKLSRMVEDLHDSERKLSKLLEQYENHGILCENGENSRENAEENGDVSREMQLRKKMEESQRILAQLQEHQASLVGMQLRVREKLNEARQAQQALLQQENQNSIGVSLPMPMNVEQLESETAALKGKLAQLQTKKKNMDHLVAELQAVEMSDRGSCSSEASRNFIRDKAAELEAMKAQLVHLKSLMDEATKVRESLDSNSDAEPEVDVNGEIAADMDGNEDEHGTNISFERQSDIDEASHEKIRNTGDRPSVEEIQAVTRELREQSVLLQTARAELQRIRQPLSTMHSNSTSIFQSSTPPPSLTTSTSSEKKLSNNNNYEVQSTQGRRRQIDDIDSSQASSMNRDIGGPPDLNSHRSSSSHISHTGTPANVWPPQTMIGGSNDQSVDGVSSENLMDIGPQTTAVENGFSGNWWTYPPPPLNQLQHGSTEYYRQLLLGSQAQQLQMMGTTIQQCCQLLWSQQRELQAMRTAISQLQVHLRQTQLQQRNDSENNDEYSNLSRNVHHLGETLDSALPPSSSLPNLVSLPNSSPALSHVGATSSVNSQHQQQQLNNQVPPGNRANNYWDNFRSYSRQNLLSGSVKTMTDTTSGPTANSASGNTISSVNTSLMKDKRNRDQGADNIPPPPLSGIETQYSSNLQLQSNLQQQEWENTVMRSNILTNEVSQQQVDNIWEETHSSFRLPSVVNDDNPFQNLREIQAISRDRRLRSRLWRTLRVLQGARILRNPLNKTTDPTVSESWQTTDEDSEVDVLIGLTPEKHPAAELVASSQAGTSSSPTVHVPLLDHLYLPGIHSADSTSALPLTSSTKPGYNEDLAEADQSRPESSGNQQRMNRIKVKTACRTAEAKFDENDLESLAAKAEDERHEVNAMIF